MKYIAGLNSLRAFAVLSVIYQHWGPLQFRIPWIRFIFMRLVPLGTFGVDIFFVLSGYLITRILLDACMKAQSDRIKIVKSFYFRRALRIFPIYFIVIFTVAYLLNDNYAKAHIVSFATYTSNFLYIKGSVSWQTLPHTWSLAVEEQFYLIWPWIIIYTPQKYQERMILACIGLGIVSSLVLYSFYGAFFSFLLPGCFIAFGAGAWYAYVQVYQKRVEWLPRFLTISFPLCIILMVISQTFYPFVLIRVVDSIIGLGLIFYIVRQDYNPVSSYLLQNRVLIWLGKISYSVYLIHFMLPFYYVELLDYLQKQQVIGASLHKLLKYIPLLYLINLVALVIICSISYNLIETPFLKLKKYFAYGESKKVYANAPRIF